MGKKIRLDKYLSDMGMGSRSELKKTIIKGQVRIGNQIIIRPETKVDKDIDKVYLNDSLINYREFIYFILNKPAGVVSATKDNINKTVIDLIHDKSGKELFPVGRLDKDTEGLLFITNDGGFAHNILSPRKEIDKVYYAKVKGEITDEDKHLLESGVRIDNDYLTLPAKLKIIESGDVSIIELTIREGKFHQVKQMIQAVGKQVTYLKRISMAGLSLDDDLLPGEYRELSHEELRTINQELQQRRI